jgi:hypothetical protein
MIKKTTFIVILIIPIICGIASLYLGKDVNWDLRNYHYYNAYAFLEHRLDFDIAPAQLQTFYNPFLDLPFFWMTQSLSSKTIGFILGCLHGINLSLIFLIFFSITSFSHQFWKIVIGMVVIMMSGLAPGFFSELGGTMNDNVTSIFVLLAIFFILIAYDHFEQKKAAGRISLFLLMAGFIMGIGVGLKPTIAPYALSSALALMVVFPTWKHRIRYFLCYSSAGIVGGIVSAGFWWWEMWTHYANPLFPYFNNIFQSPYIQASVFTDTRFFPHHLWEYVVWPLLFSWNSQRVTELSFSDIRFAIVFIAYLIWGICVLFRSKKPQQQHFHHPQIMFLIVFFALSFILWVITFSYYRYLVSLELLLPIILFALLERIISTNRIRMTVAILLTIVICLVFIIRPLNWGRVRWSDPYVNIKTNESLERTDNAVMVMLGYSPMAYVIPYFPATTRFIRPEGNLGLCDEDLFFQKIKQVVEHQKASGKIFLLYDKRDPSVNLEASSSRLGLNLSQLKCSLFEMNQYDHLTICEVLYIIPSAHKKIPIEHID